MTVEEKTSLGAIPLDIPKVEGSPLQQSMRDRGEEELGLHDAAQELGARIKAARESANMTVEAIGELLKLTPETILALENGDLPVIEEKRLIYIEGYYRSYANALDIDIGDTRFSVDHARPIDTGVASGQINYQATAKQSLTEYLRERSDAIIFGLVAVMVVVVGGVIWSVWPSSDELVDTASTGVVVAPTDSAQTQSSRGDRPFYLTEDADSTYVNESRDLISSQPFGEIADRVDAAVDDEDRPDVTITEGIDPGEAHGVAGTDATSMTVPSTVAVMDASDTSDATEVTQDTGVVVISFSGPSWVEVYGANDERLYYKMGQRDEIASLVGLLPFKVRIGDASVVRVRFNNAEVDLAPHTFGNVANLTLQ